jgi:hypothetical protein
MHYLSSVYSVTIPLHVSWLASSPLTGGSNVYMQQLVRVVRLSHCRQARRQSRKLVLFPPSIKEEREFYSVAPIFASWSVWSWVKCPGTRWGGSTVGALKSATNKHQSKHSTRRVTELSDSSASTALIQMDMLSTACCMSHHLLPHNPTVFTCYRTITMSWFVVS